MDHVDQTSDSRSEFRSVLRQIVSCLRSELNVPGVSPFNPDELKLWLQTITEEDIRAVWDE